MSRAFSMSSFSLIGDPAGEAFRRSLDGSRNSRPGDGGEGGGAGGAADAGAGRFGGSWRVLSRLGGGAAAEGSRFSTPGRRGWGGGMGSPLPAILARAARLISSFSCFFRTARCIFRRRRSSFH